MNTTNRTRCAFNVAAACVFLLTSGFAMAVYPEKPIRIVVGTAAGTPIDLVSRVVAGRMAKELGQAIVIDNKLGAGGIVGGAEVMRHPADGYTLLNIFLPMSAAPALMPRIPFDLQKDFVPIGQMVWSYNVMVSHPSVAAKTVPEAVSLLKANPGQMSFASGGVGTPAQLAGALFKIETKTSAINVPYNQYGQAVSDLVGGTHQFMFGASTAMLPFITSGKLRALAVTSPTRLPTLPEVPTLLELGYKELVIRDWQGLAAKAGTPPAIIARLNAALAVALTDPDVMQSLAKVGAVPVGGTPESFGQLIIDETARWAVVIKRQNLKAE